MNQTMKNSLKAAFLVIPVLVLCGLVVKAELDKRHGPVWIMKVEGYDPRDILRGQYVLFRFDWNWVRQPDKDCQNCCVCLNDKEGVENPVAEIMHCDRRKEELKSCTSVIRHWDNAQRASNRRREPYMNSYRYYLQEDHARALQRRLNEQRRNNTENSDVFHLKMNVTNDGRMIFHDFLINGKPYAASLSD